MWTGISGIFDSNSEKSVHNGFTVAKKILILDSEDVIFVVGTLPCLTYFQN